MFLPLIRDASSDHVPDIVGDEVGGDGLVPGVELEGVDVILLRVDHEPADDVL